DETHGRDFDGAVRLDEENGGNHGKAVGIGDSVCRVVEEDGEGDADRTGEVAGGGSVVLRDAEKGHAVGLVALVQAFEEGEREFADRAGHFEEGEYDRAFFEGARENKLLAVESFQGEVGSGIARYDVGHAVVCSEPAVKPAK